MKDIVVKKTDVCRSSTIYRDISDFLRTRYADTANRGTDIVAYTFFTFSRDIPASQSMDFVYRFLLLQMCASDTIPEEIDTMHKHNSIGPSENNFRDTLFAILHRWQTQVLDMSSNRQSMDTDSVHHVRSLTVVMDAIDELPSIKLRDDMLRFVEQLHALDREHPHFRVRVALCSRESDVIRRVCSSPGWNVIVMPASEIQEDIRKFIRERIRQSLNMRSMPESDQERVCERVAAKAQNM